MTDRSALAGHPDASARTGGVTLAEDALRLHIGGQAPRPGWKIFNIQAGPGVDYVGNCMDLSQFSDESVDAVYASHVLEHLAYMSELGVCLAEVHRVLKPGGDFMISVPDMDVLCELFIHPDVSSHERHGLMRMMFGGQVDAFDYHKVGFNWDILTGYLNVAGFKVASRVERFDLFEDCSALQFRGNLISLNVIAHR